MGMSSIPTATMVGGYLFQCTKLLSIFVAQVLIHLTLFWAKTSNLLIWQSLQICRLLWELQCLACWPLLASFLLPLRNDRGPLTFDAWQKVPKTAGWICKKQEIVFRRLWEIGWTKRFCKFFDWPVIVDYFGCVRGVLRLALLCRKCWRVLFISWEIN